MNQCRFDFAILELDRPISELQTLEKGNSDDVEINEQINIIKTKKIEKNKESSKESTDQIIDKQIYSQSKGLGLSRS